MVARLRYQSQLLVLRKAPKTLRFVFGGPRILLCFLSFGPCKAPQTVLCVFGRHCKAPKTCFLALRALQGPQELVCAVRKHHPHILQASRAHSASTNRTFGQHSRTTPIATQSPATSEPEVSPNPQRAQNIRWGPAGWWTAWCLWNVRVGGHTKLGNVLGPPRALQGRSAALGGLPSPEVCCTQG